MRETRLYGSEGGGTEINRSFLPLYDLHRYAVESARHVLMGLPGSRGVGHPVAWAAVPARVAAEPGYGIIPCTYSRG
jgi:hypothetical protein